MFNSSVLVSVSLCSVLGLLVRCVRLFGTCNKIPERSGLNDERFIGTHCFGQWSCGSTALKPSGSVEILTEGHGRRKLFTRLLTDRKQEEYRERPGSRCTFKDRLPETPFLKVVPTFHSSTPSQGSIKSLHYQCTKPLIRSESLRSNFIWKCPRRHTQSML